MKTSKFTIPILITFYIRHETLQEIFNVIRVLQPLNLILASDGPKTNKETEIFNINQAREIFETIDWECNVVKLYSDFNLGILNNTLNAYKYSFNNFDKLIIIEDDILPSLDFFYFCNELLNKYENDNRISFINGGNPFNLGRTSNYSYFFSRTFVSGANAFWSRTFSDLNYIIENGLSSEQIHELKNQIYHGYDRLYFKYLSRKFKSNINLSHEAILLYLLIVNSQVSLTPHKNLVSSIAESSNSRHAPDNNLKLPRALRVLQQYKLEPLDWPLAHPRFLNRDYIIESKINRIQATFGYPLVNFYRNIERYFYTVVYGNFVEANRRLIDYFNILLFKKENDKDG